MSVKLQWKNYGVSAYKLLITYSYNCSSFLARNHLLLIFAKNNEIFLTLTAYPNSSIFIESRKYDLRYEVFFSCKNTFCVHLLLYTE